jgi:hypothetical protein
VVESAEWIGSADASMTVVHEDCFPRRVGVAITDKVGSKIASEAKQSTPQTNPRHWPSSRPRRVGGSDPRSVFSKVSTEHISLRYKREAEHSEHDSRKYCDDYFIS